MTARLMALTLLGCLLALHSGVAQDVKPDKGQPPGPADDTTPPQRRTVHPLRHADPNAVAQVIARHFKGQVEVSPLDNGLFLSASPTVTDEVTRLLEQIDRKPRSVRVEVILADVTLRKGPDGKDAEVDLTGDVAGKLEAMAKTGQATVQRVKLAAVEGQPVTSTTGGNRPVVTAAAIAGGPGGGFGGKGGGAVMQRSVSYHSVGTTVKLTARVGAEGVVAVDLNVQESKVRPPEAGEEAAAPSMDNTTLATHVNVPAGRAVVAQSVRSDGKTGTTLSLVLVVAQAVDDGATMSK
jgi:hypothetical protein